METVTKLKLVYTKGAYSTEQIKRLMDCADEMNLKYEAVPFVDVNILGRECVNYKMNFYEVVKGDGEVE